MLGMLFASLSKTTKLILLDSLLQEVCISSGFDWSLTLSSLGLSVCLSQSQTSFFRAKESPLNIWNVLFNRVVLYPIICLSLFFFHICVLLLCQLSDLQQNEEIIAAKVGIDHFHWISPVIVSSSFLFLCTWFNLDDDMLV